MAERIVSISLLLGGVSLLLLGCGTLNHAGAEGATWDKGTVHSEVLSVGRLQVVGADGVVRLVLGVSESGEPFVELKGPESGGSVRLETIGRGAHVTIGGGEFGKEQIIELDATEELTRIRLVPGRSRWPVDETSRGGIVLVRSDEEGSEITVFQDGKQDVVLRPGN